MLRARISFLLLLGSLAWAAPIDPVLTRLLVPEGKAWARSDSLAVLKQVLADERYSPEEAELLKRLTGADSGALVVESIAIAKPTGEALRVLQLVTQEQNLASLWKGGPADMQSLIDLSTLSPQTYRQVEGNIALQLREVWKQTSSTNHLPLKDEIRRAFQLMQSLDSPSQKLGYRLLYRALQVLDRSTNNAVPDYLYEWLKDQR